MRPIILPSGDRDIQLISSPGLPRKMSRDVPDVRSVRTNRNSRFLGSPAVHLVSKMTRPSSAQAVMLTASWINRHSPLSPSTRQSPRLSFDEPRKIRYLPSDAHPLAKIYLSGLNLSGKSLVFPV